MISSGLEFKEFMNDNNYWPEDSSIDDDLILVDGKEIDPDVFSYNSIPNESIVNVKSGVVCFENRKSVNLETFFRNWRKKQNTSYLLIEIDREKEIELRRIIKDKGGKIL